jgi:hypothetical protein
MESIYIVLTQTYSGIARLIKFFTHDKYSHVSISFDRECKYMYSFGRKYRYFPFYGVFNHEKLDKGLFTNNGSLIAIYEVKISKEKYNQIKKKVRNIKETNRGYNIMGLLLAYFKIKLHRNKYYCSEFVYEVLSDEEVKLIEKTDNIFKPEDLIKELNYNKLFEGKIIDYIN